MMLAIDFNGVLCDRRNVPEGHRLGAPLEGAKKAMRELKKNNTLYIHTDMASTTKGYQAVQEWLDYFQIPWDYITNSKPPRASVFLDDRAIRFINWDQALNDILKTNGPNFRSKQHPSLDSW